MARKSEHCFNVNSEPGILPLKPLKKDVTYGISRLALKKIFMKKIAIKYGVLMLVGFIAFFLIMHVLGHSLNYNLRAFNGVIHIGLIALAIREYRKTHPESLSNYISGVAMGMYASLIGVLG